MEIVGDLIFTDETHSYLDDVRRYTSVSAFTKPYFPYFDSYTNTMRRAFIEYDEDLYAEAKKHHKYYDPEIIDWMILSLGSNITDIESIESRAKEIGKEWSDSGVTAAIDGTAKHDLFEHVNEQKEFILNPITGTKHRVIKRKRKPGVYDNIYVLEDLLKRKESMYIAECIVCDPKTGRAGQIDKLWLYWTGSRYIAIIGDYKTDKKIDRLSFFMPRNMLAPFDFINASKLNYYTFKMSCYAIMTERLGIEVASMYIYHVPHNKSALYIKLGNFAPLIRRKLNWAC